jgi:hypothetical protein
MTMKTCVIPQCEAPAPRNDKRCLEHIRENYIVLQFPEQPIEREHNETYPESIETYPEIDPVPVR